MFIGRIDLLKSLTKQSNLFLPFGKVRMGSPFGKVRMGYPFGKVRMGCPWGRFGWVILQRKRRLVSGGGGGGGGWHGVPWRY